MTNNIKLQEVCKQLHIPVVGTTSWPLPREAREILQRHRLSISLSYAT